MRKMCVFWAPVFAILLALFILPAAAYADATVVCPGGGVGAFSSIGAALAAIGQTGPSTITVTGTCAENVSLNNARSITIVAGPSGASVVEPDDNNAFDISLSQDIHLVNLDISTTGPDAGGVVITDASEVHIVGCNIHNNQSVGVDADTGSILFLQDTTIQNNNPNDGLDVIGNSSADVIRTTIQNNGNSQAGGVGVFLTGSSTIVFRQTNSILNNADIGIEVLNLSAVNFETGFPGRFTTVQGHNANGILVRRLGDLVIGGASPHVVQGNGAACPLDPTCGGIFANQDSTVILANATITSNQGSGVSAQQGASVVLGGATVSNNTGDGVHIQWISTGNFQPGNTITGNGGKSVFCDTTSLAVGDLSTFSNVGCAQIARPTGPPRPGRAR